MLYTYECELFCKSWCGPVLMRMHSVPRVSDTMSLEHPVTREIKNFKVVAVMHAFITARQGQRIRIWLEEIGV